MWSNKIVAQKFIINKRSHVSLGSGSALQADVSESGSLLLVEKRQADRRHRGDRPHHHPHHHPAGHWSHPHQRASASYSQPYNQALNVHTHTVHIDIIQSEVIL